jgi:hypothetical protein
MRDYQSRAVDRVFNRNITALRNNMNKLIATTGYYTCTKAEVWQEMCLLFYQNFEEYYEADRQYLSFLFICLKNRIRNMQKSQYNREGRYSTDTAILGAQIGALNDEQTSYQDIWGQVPDPDSPWPELELQEIIDSAVKLMDKMGKDTFDSLMADAQAVNQVSETMQLMKIKNPTPVELRRLRRLERKQCGSSTVSEVIRTIETSIKPVFDRSELSMVGI